MGEAALVADLRDKGRRFVEILDAGGAAPTVAFWAKPDDEADWVLILSRPEFERLGPRKSYEAIQGFFRDAAASLEPLTFASIRVVPENHQLIELASLVVATAPDAIANIHSAGNVINGVRLPDSLIYRMAPSHRQKQRAATNGASS